MVNVEKGSFLIVFFFFLFLQDLELQESVLQSDYDVKRTDLETEVCELEEKIAAGMDSDHGKA